MKTNITTVNIARDDAKAPGLYQYDYGQKLLFTGADLPDYYEVHFSANFTDESMTQLGDDSGVSIPDTFLTQPGTVHAWIFLHDGLTDGETVRHITIPVAQRSAPGDGQPTPVEQSAFTEGIAALTAKTAEAAEYAAEAQQAAEDAQAIIREGAVPATRKINGHELSADVALTASDVGAVPTTRKVNNKALSADVTLTASDVGAVPTTRKITINGTQKTLDQDVEFTVQSGGTGTVSSVRVQAASPVVSSVSTAQTASLDTIISLANNYGDTKSPYASKTANYVLAAPDGSAGTPSFRALVANDVPNISANKIKTGTMTGPLTISMNSGATGCYVKNTNIDLSSATNGVSSTNQPGFLMQDKNLYNIAYFRGYVESNGNTGYRIGAHQYDTSGNLVSQAVLGVSIAKDGTQTWTMPIPFQDAVLARALKSVTLTPGTNVSMVSSNLVRFGRVIALNFVVNVTAELATNATIATIGNIDDSTGGPIAYLCAHKGDGTFRTFIKVKDQKTIIANGTIPTGYWYVNACIMV